MRQFYQSAREPPVFTVAMFSFALNQKHLDEFSV